MKNIGQIPALLLLLFRDPAGTRTQDPYIKSVLLYQLSYEIYFRFFAGANIGWIILFARTILLFFKISIKSRCSEL